jgi:hypothetical protein
MERIAIHGSMQMKDLNTFCVEIPRLLNVKADNINCYSFVVKGTDFPRCEQKLMSDNNLGR